MIYGYLHQGSGVGNQLHRYVATRVRALDLGADWRMIYNPDGSGKVEGFKCKDFMDFDESKILYEKPVGVKEWNEKKVVENGVDIRGYDPEFNFVQDSTIIDGEFQDERYFERRLDAIDGWLKVEPLKMVDDVCVIGFRGGEFKVFPELFLTKEYWDGAISLIRQKCPNCKFEVHTDDPTTSKEFFPKFPIIHDVGVNWRSMRYAKYAIIANSSFYILPRLLKHNDGLSSTTIAPRFWARRNTCVWALPQNYYSRFTYI